MRVEIEKIGHIVFIPENDSDEAIIDHWENKYFLMMNGSRKKKGVCNHEVNEVCECETEKICFTELQELKDIDLIRRGEED